MKTGLIRTDTKNMTHEQWQLFRMQNGIGASEAAVVLNLNPYQSAVKLFYDKVEMNIENIENEKMFWGSRLEDTVADVWKYWGGDMEQTIQNYNNGIKVNDCQRVNYIIQNPKYPHLLGNIDRLITKKNGNKKEGILEIKTMSDYATKIWEAELPPYHLVQLQTYMGICGLDYGELAILSNGRTMSVYEFQFNSEIFEGIVEKTKIFWSNVCAARELKKVNQPFEQFEPEPDDSVAYEKFMKERFKTNPISIPGNHELLKIAQEEKELNAKIKETETIKQRCKNILIKELTNHQAEKIDFGAAGYVSLRENSKGSKMFLNKVL